jgi:methylated-DNA-[protein]-cysteine S-methyltransferase
MAQTFLHLFDTALGRCGIAWGEKGVLSASFPEISDALTCQRLRRRAVGAVESTSRPQSIQNAEAQIVNLMGGEKDTLLEIELDFSGISEFECSVYDLSRQILPGKTRTYGELARDLGDVAYSQRVGQALGRNPFPIIVPCHRIIGADGKMTGFSAPGGIKTKCRLLKIEGAIDPDLFDLL